MCDSMMFSHLWTHMETVSWKEFLVLAIFDFSKLWKARLQGPYIFSEGSPHRCLSRFAAMASSRLKDLLEFLSVMQSQAGTYSEEKQSKLLDACLTDFLVGPKVPMAEGTIMAKDVQEAVLPQAMKDKVIARLEEKMLKDSGSTQTRGKTGNGTQQHRYLQNYFTKGEWDDLRSDLKSRSSKIQVLKERFMKIGLRNPTETTFVLANAMLHVASYTGPIDMMECDLNRAFDVLKDIKTTHRTSLKRFQSSGIDDYPEDPSAMGECLFTKAYRHGPPVPCPLDVAYIQKLADVLPARGTHAEVARSKVKLGSLGGTSVGPDEMMGRVLSNALMNFMSGQPSGGSLQIDGFRSSKKKKQPLALEDIKEDDDKSELDTKKHAPSIQATAIEDRQDDAGEIPVEDMAANIEGQLDSNEGLKDEKPASTKTNKTVQKKTKDKKVQGPKNAKPKGGAKKLQFPGTTDQGAIHLDVCTIYTCPKSLNWRVKKVGDKKDKSFSWKKDKPSEVWERVVAFVSELQG